MKKIFVAGVSILFLFIGMAFAGDKSLSTASLPMGPNYDANCSFTNLSSDDIQLRGVSYIKDDGTAIDKIFFKYTECRCDNEYFDCYDEDEVNDVIIAPGTTCRRADFISVGLSNTIFLRCVWTFSGKKDGAITLFKTHNLTKM
jgi:hypothetical protein